MHARANYRCEFQANDGRRCSSRTGLQIEHVRPFGIYHSNDERFLELLCADHNGLAAERVYGPDFIQRKIDERRTAQTSRSPPVGLLNRLDRRAAQGGSKYLGVVKLDSSKRLVLEPAGRG